MGAGATSQPSSRKDLLKGVQNQCKQGSQWYAQNVKILVIGLGMVVVHTFNP